LRFPDKKLHHQAGPETCLSIEFWKVSLEHANGYTQFSEILLSNLPPPDALELQINSQRTWKNLDISPASPHDIIRRHE
jgi:hypothetical protein